MSMMSISDMHWLSFLMAFFWKKESKNQFLRRKNDCVFFTGRWSLDSSRCAVDSQVPLVGRGGPLAEIGVWEVGFPTIVGP